MKIKKKELERLVQRAVAQHVEFETAQLKGELKEARATSEAFRLRGNEVWQEREGLRIRVEHGDDAISWLNSHLVTARAEITALKKKLNPQPEDNEDNL